MLVRSTDLINLRLQLSIKSHYRFVEYILSHLAIIILRSSNESLKPDKPRQERIHRAKIKREKKRERKFALEWSRGKFGYKFERIGRQRIVEEIYIRRTQLHRSAKQSRQRNLLSTITTPSACRWQNCILCIENSSAKSPKLIRWFCERPCRIYTCMYVKICARFMIVSSTFNSFYACIIVSFNYLPWDAKALFIYIRFTWHDSARSINVGWRRLQLLKEHCATCIFNWILF